MGFRDIFTTRGAKEPLSSSEDLPLLVRARKIIQERWFFFRDSDDDTEKVRTPDGDLVALGGGGSGGSVSRESLVVTVADVLAAPGETFASERRDVIDETFAVTAVESGISGNAIGVVFDVPAPPHPTISVDVDGTIITVHLAVDGGGNPVSTRDEIGEAINGDLGASALVTVETHITTGSPVPYEDGDIYLTNGQSRLTVASLAEGSIIWDAQVFIPQAWDATTTFRIEVGSGNAGIYYTETDPDPTVVDDTGAEGVAVAQNDIVFNLARRLRLTEDGDLTVRVTSEAGAIPTEGEMQLCVLVVAP